MKDKRRFSADGSVKENPDEEKAQEETAQPEAEQASEHVHEHRHEHEPGHAEEDRIPPPNVYAMLQFVVGMLTEQAWQLMGIRLAPGQKEMIKDMAQAKLAIDTISFIADKLAPHVEEQDRRALRAIVSDLQMNFVMQNK